MLLRSLKTVHRKMSEENRENEMEESIQDTISREESDYREGSDAEEERVESRIVEEKEDVRFG